jgi:hypothetical protein
MGELFGSGLNLFSLLRESLRILRDLGMDEESGGCILLPYSTSMDGVYAFRPGNCVYREERPMRRPDTMGCSR